MEASPFSRNGSMVAITLSNFRPPSSGRFCEQLEQLRTKFSRAIKRALQHLQLHHDGASASETCKIVIGCMRILCHKLKSVGVKQASAIVAAWTPIGTYMSEELLDHLLGHEERTQEGGKEDEWKTYKDFYIKAVETMQVMRMTAKELERVVWCMYHLSNYFTVSMGLGSLCFGMVAQERALSRSSSRRFRRRRGIA